MIEEKDYIAWQIPNMRRVVKAEFMAMAVRCGLSAAGLLEDVLTEYLRAQGIRIGVEQKIRVPKRTKFKKL